MFLRIISTLLVVSPFLATEAVAIEGCLNEKELKRGIRRSVEVADILSQNLTRRIKRENLSSSDWAQFSSVVQDLSAPESLNGKTTVTQEKLADVSRTQENREDLEKSIRDLKWLDTFVSSRVGPRVKNRVTEVQKKIWKLYLHVRCNEQVAILKRKYKRIASEQGEKLEQNYNRLYISNLWEKPTDCSADITDIMTAGQVATLCGVEVDELYQEKRLQLAASDRNERNGSESDASGENKPRHEVARADR